jgi:ribonuclease P protein component
LGKLARRVLWKRRVRAALEKRLGKIAAGLDLIFVLRPAILMAEFEQIDSSVEDLLKRMGAMSA